MNIAVITVTYNGGEMALVWADAVAAARARFSAGALTVVAVDNASPEGTGERLCQHAPHVEVVQMTENVGFAAACNVGAARATRADVFAFINPDVLVHPTFFERLEMLEWPADVAVMGPKIVDDRGGVEQSARAFPTISTGVWGRTTILTRMFPAAAASRGLMADPSRGARRVDWVSGACFIVTRNSWEAVGSFDEGYWMYWEDADWCRRAQARGLFARYEPSLVAHHHQGSSSASRPLATIVAFHRSAARYYRRHSGVGRFRIRIAEAILAGRCLLKLAAAILASTRAPAR